MKLVIVKWIDSVTFDSWNTLDFVDKTKPKTCFTCGFLINEDKDKLIVALLTDCDKHIASWITIPASCVQDIKVLGTMDDEGNVNMEYAE